MVKLTPVSTGSLPYENETSRTEMRLILEVYAGTGAPIDSGTQRIRPTPTMSRRKMEEIFTGRPLREASTIWPFPTYMPT